MSAKTKSAAKTGTKKGKALALRLRSVKPFKGFAHTVKEGKELSRRSRTELPEFAELSREK